MAPLHRCTFLPRGADRATSNHVCLSARTVRRFGLVSWSGHRPPGIPRKIRGHWAPRAGFHKCRWGVGLRTSVLLDRVSQALAMYSVHLTSAQSVLSYHTITRLVGKVRGDQCLSPRRFVKGDFTGQPLKPCAAPFCCPSGTTSLARTRIATEQEKRVMPASVARHPFPRRRMPCAQRRPA